MPQIFNSWSRGQVKVLRLAAALALILLLFFSIDLAEAFQQLKGTDWRWLIPALLLIQVQLVLSALRWKITAARLGQPLSGLRAIAEYYLATFANLSLPGGITGDAARVYRNRDTETLSIAVHSVMLERLAGQLALLVVSTIGWMLWPLLMQGSLPRFGVYVMSMVFAMIVLGALSLYGFVRFAPDRLTRFIVEIGPSMHAAWYADRQWLVQGVLSVAIVSSYGLVFLFSSYAVGEPLPLPAVITLVPLVLLSMLIPLSIGGWGVREAAAALLWPVVGLSAEAGVATSVVYALTSLLGCLPGLALLLLSKRD